MSEEIDMPVIVKVLDDTLQQLREHDDYGSFTKRELAVNQDVILDLLLDMAKYMVVMQYKIDIIDKSVGTALGLKEMIDEMPETPVPTTPDFFS